MPNNKLTPELTTQGKYVRNVPSVPTSTNSGTKLRTDAVSSLNINPSTMTPGERRVEINKQAEAAADKLVQDAARYANTGWTLAINSKNDIGVKGWGYNYQTADGANDGDVILWNKYTNETKTIDDDMATIYSEEISKFKDQERESKFKFDKALEFEQRVAEAEADMEKSRSILDVVCDLVHIASPYTQATVAGGVVNTAPMYEQQDLDRIKEVMSGLVETSWLNRVGISQDINTKEIGELLYNGQTEEALSRLNELKVSPREQNMVAYYAAKQQGDMKYALTYTDALKGMGVEALMNFGEDMDFLQAGVRATYLWFQVNGPLAVKPDSGKFREYSDEQYELLHDKTLSEAIASAYEASWVNQGRQNYDFDTGYLAYDLALEICTDPENIVRFISNAASKLTANTATSALVGAGYIDSFDMEKTVSRRLKAIIHSGDMDKLDEVVELIAKNFPGSESGIKSMIKQSLDYSSTYKLAKATGVLRDAKDLVDDLMLWMNGTKLYGTVIRTMFDEVSRATQFLSSGKLVIKAKAIADAIAQVEGKYGDINITDVKEFIDYAKLNLSTLSNVEHNVVQLTREEIYGIILDTYRRDYALAELPDRPEVAKNAKQVLEMNGLMDTPLYQLLETPSSTDVCIPLQALVSKGDAKDILTPEFAERMGTHASMVIDDAADSGFTDIITDQGKIYKAKVNRTFEAEHFMRDGYVQAFNEQLFENPAEVIATAKTDRAVAHMISNTVAESNYTTIKANLKEARDAGIFTDEEYTNVLTQLYSPKTIAEAKRTFPVSASMTPYQINGRATRLAKDIVDDTFNTEVQLSNLSATNLLEYKCNMLNDLDGSVENMAKHYTAEDGIIPMFYFAKFDDRNDLVDLVFRTQNGDVKHFTNVKDIDAYLIEQSYAATKSGSTLKMVGFNNHGTGFNTDSHMRDWLTYHNSTAVYRFTKTGDIADDIRISRGFLPPSEAQYEAVKGAIIDAHKQWKTYAALSIDNSDVYLPFSITAPLAKDVQDVVDLAAEGSTLDKGLVNSLNSKLDDWNDIYHHFELNGNHATTDFNVAKTFHNQYAGALQVKKVWDSAQNYTVFDKALIDEAVTAGKFDSWAATEVADEVYSTLLDLREASIAKLDVNGINQAWDIAVRTATAENPMVFAKANTPTEKMAWLLTANKHDEWFVNRSFTYYGGNWTAFFGDPDNWKLVPVYETDAVARTAEGNLKKIGTDTHSLSEFMDDEFTLLRKTSNRLTDLEPTLPGRFGNAANNWAVQQEMADTIKELRASDEGIIAVNKYLREQGKVTPLAQYYLESEVEMHEIYGQIEDLYNSFIDAQASSATRVITDENGATLTLDLYHEFTKDIRGAATNHFNRGLMVWSQQHLTDRVGFISKLDDTDLETYLAKYALGRMYIDTETLDPVTIASVKTRLAANTNPHIAYDMNKKGIRVYLTGIDTPDVRNLPDLKHTFETRLTKENVLAQINPSNKRVTDAMDLTAAAVAKQQDLIYNLAKHNDLSFGFGNFVANSPALYKQVNEKYFSDLDLVDFSKYAGRGYECAYFGQIDGLRMEGQFFSSNILVNMANAWTTTCRQQRTLNDICIAVFDSGVDGHTMIKRMLDSHTVTPETLASTGYHWIQWTPDGIKDLDLRTYNPKTFKEHTALLAKPDYDKLIDIAKHSAAPEELNAFQRVIRGVVEPLNAMQQALISAYLYSNPETGIHNVVDSSLKGILSEGSDHIGYMFEANYLNRAVNEARLQIVKQIEAELGQTPTYISKADINKFFAKGDVMVSGGMLSKNRFLQVLEYHKSGYTDSLESIAELLGDAEQADRFTSPIANAISKASEEFFDMKLLKFNQKLFGWAEGTNRLAIWLRHMDMGDDLATAAQHIATSQFDYTKNAAMKGLNGFAPFIQFRLNNMCYWFDKGVANPGLFGDFTKLYQYETDFRHQTAEEQDYRAWLYTLDYSQFAQDEVEAFSNYNPIFDYKGATNDTAKDNGWIKMGDKLYFKLGFSLMDAFTGHTVIAQPFSNSFAPLATLVRSTLSTINTPKTKETIDALEQLGMGGLDIPAVVAAAKKQGTLEALEQNYFEVTSLIPIVGTLISRFANSYRNATLGDKIKLDSISGLLATFLPGLFAIKRPSEPSKQSYLDRPIGYDWYNQTDEYRATHRYIPGMSYVPTWVAKSASHYINTYGRLQLLGMNKEQVQQLFTDGGTFWWTENNEGEFELHNYKLMIKDKETEEKIFRDLISFGWTRDQAIRLIEEASEPTWTIYPKKQNNRLPGAYTSLQGYRRYANIHIPYQMMPNQLGDRMRKGKNVKLGAYDVVKPKVAHNNTAKTIVKWHKRSRDIYKSNYAKYGASRMAMTQNLKSYSNKSIVQLHREEQQQRYAIIHRHQRW